MPKPTKTTEPILVITSSGRPANVPAMDAKVPGAWWYVPEDEVTEYLLAGASRVVGVPGTRPMKHLQLNAALDLGESRGCPVVTMDDDLIDVRDRTSRTPVPLSDLIAGVLGLLRPSGLRLGGPYVGGNTSWSKGTVRQGRVHGALMAHLPSPLRFIPGIAIDLDYTIQHHLVYGGALLCGEYCLRNEWMTNDGGLKPHRTPEAYRAANARLTARWGAYGASFTSNQDSPNLVRYRVPWGKLVAHYQTTGPIEVPPCPPA